MKKQVKLVGTVAMMGALLAGGASSVSATTFNGQSTGNVPVTGRVGLDNVVDPGVTPPTNPNEMINVTVPTSALFYTTGESRHTEIESPSYAITNNSAWDVNINVTELANPVAFDSLDSLNLAVNVAGTNSILPIVTSGVALNAPTSFMSLTRNTTAGGANPVGTFVFAGTAIPGVDTSEVATPSFDMVLQFQAVAPNA
ncbi:hypothetical protein [Enterococcus mundtii]|uniref:hypothetical protein n=1 Tax=Enterococcus mundtii TaxID=53346 RepID=UPI0008248BE9|nr:hypothetical protein [Enterococcus mundtii]